MFLRLIINILSVDRFLNAKKTQNKYFIYTTQSSSIYNIIDLM